MKHRKHDNASGVSPTKLNILREMRVRMPKVPANVAPQTADQSDIPAPLVHQPTNSAPPTNSS